ncbi:Mushroom body large-type Kenyon cell-specific protein 1 [Trichinella nelsoni]|uniref:Mushroom body large-type Kenyon cell-specific protein 1 n=1 Tax=Trichinella nelsoni TaxID=6336 RepID=A0A0V0RTY7_9BILA|nr:Mushroom body large-type Kenyon cell-specific protein 1 [Trichinella nelsoni]
MATGLPHFSTATTTTTTTTTTNSSHTAYIIQLDILLWTEREKRSMSEFCSPCKRQRCSAERKSRFRDLQRWNKSLLLLLVYKEKKTKFLLATCFKRTYYRVRWMNDACSVEQVCERLFDRASWQSINAITDPRRCFVTAGESERVPTDWNPNEGCYVCQSSSYNNNNNSNSPSNNNTMQQQEHKEQLQQHHSEQDLTVSPNATVVANELPTNGNNNNQRRYSSSSLLSLPTEDHQPMISFGLTEPNRDVELNTTGVEFPFFGSPNHANYLLAQWQRSFAYSFYPLLPIYSNCATGLPPYCFADNLLNGAVAGQSVDSGASLFDYSKAEPLHGSGDEPLDLTVHPRRNIASVGKERVSTVPAGRSSATSSGYSSNSMNMNGNKRSYSKADLEAAVLDIRSGKLGTRRASVIYGVPRSTLRNKIHKLEAACNVAGAGVGSGTGVGSRSERRSAANNNTKQSTSATSLCGEVSSGRGRPLAGNSSGKTSKATNCKSSLTRTVVSPNQSVQDLALQICAKQLTSALEMQNQTAAMPAAAATNGRFLNPTLMTMPSRSMLLGLIGLDAELCTNTDSRAAGNVADRSSIVDSRPQMTAEATSDGAGSRSSSDANQLDEANAKKLRRKRGQYRKYDKNALALAVQSVRRGEMSVHKAGSFYGVPHSTLEYKVKERNLLRAKKQQQAETASSSNNNKKAAENPTTPCTIAPRQNAETVENCEFLNLQYPSKLAIVENSSIPFGQTGHFVEEPNKAAATDEAINDCSIKIDEQQQQQQIDSMEVENSAQVQQQPLELVQQSSWRKMRRKKSTPKKITSVDSSSIVDYAFVPLATN